MAGKKNPRKQDLDKLHLNQLLAQLEKKPKEKGFVPLTRSEVWQHHEDLRINKVKPEKRKEINKTMKEKKNELAKIQEKFKIYGDTRMEFI